MDSLFSCRAFAGFGPNRLSPSPEPPPLNKVCSRRAALLRTRVRAHCSRLPGVYGMLNAQGELIYVGKAKALRTRLLSYFRDRSRDPKAGRILARTRAIVWEYAPSEFAALLRELELIRRWRPHFNVQGQPQRRRHTFVCLGRRPAPYVFLAQRPPAGVLACYGPVPAGNSCREAARRLNDWFQLRDCSQAQAMHFAEQTELFPVLRAAGCLRYELGTCLGPCAAACSRPAYMERVRAARAFLEGTDVTLLEKLHDAMTAAADALAFERAAALRDQWEVLQKLHKQLKWLRKAREDCSCVYAVRGAEGSDLWYLIHRGWVAAALPAPVGPAQPATLAALEAVYQKHDGSIRLSAADDLDGVLLVAAWFRNHPDERRHTLTPSEAAAVCRQAPLRQWLS